MKGFQLVQRHHRDHLLDLYHRTRVQVQAVVHAEILHQRKNLKSRAVVVQDHQARLQVMDHIEEEEEEMAVVVLSNLWTINHLTLVEVVIQVNKSS